MARGLRVIAGSAGGRRLLAPPGRSARPTTDRVKESVFGALGGRVVDAAVLDLYAGSGALAIEALSRGSARAVLVERDHAAVGVIRHNLEATGLAARGRVQQGLVASFLGREPPPEAPFDLVFADPPYEAAASEIIDLLQRLAEPTWLVAGARVVLERGARADPVDLPQSWGADWQRAYGDTLVTVATLD